MKIKKNNAALALQKINNEKGYYEGREVIHNDFISALSPYKTRLTQGLCWSDLDANIANQFVREESWLFGLKISDKIKLIDHTLIEEEDASSKTGGSIVGFGKGVI